MIRKIVYIMLAIIAISAIAEAADICGTDANLKIKFLKIQNIGKGNLEKNIFVGSSGTEFKEDELIPLAKNGEFIRDAGRIEDVPGISVQRGEGEIKFLLFGGKYSSKEILAAGITLENAKVEGIQNDWSRASTYPKKLNSLEGQGNGKYRLGKENQDEVFFKTGERNISWFSTISRDNDGFTLKIKCDEPIKIECNKDSDCGPDYYINEPFCEGNNISRLQQKFTCNNPGTKESKCSMTNITKQIEECEDECEYGKCVNKCENVNGCDNDGTDNQNETESNNTCEGTCEEEGNYVYVVPYIGDIDGSVSEDWLFFYDKIEKFHEENKIPTSFSFFPGTMIEDERYVKAFRNIYNNNYIELVQKGYLGDSLEQEMDKLPYEKQKEIIQKGQERFKEQAKKITGYNEIKMPKTYDQIGARVNEDTLKALEDLGFKMYFDFYIGDGLTAAKSSKDFDVIQYGVSFTTSGGAGKETWFKTPEQILKEIKEFEIENIPMISIEGHKVVPLFAHQQDFESKFGSSILDEKKWETYTTTLNMLKNNANFKIVNPKEIYKLDHKEENQTEEQENMTNICQYAKRATATSENALGSLAMYATNKPDAERNENCNDWSGYGNSWTPESWNTKATLTLTYEKPVYAKNITVFGDYDMCLEKITIKNSRTGAQKVITTKNEMECTIKKEIEEDFLADTVELESCGWSWSATDSVELCGKASEETKPEDKGTEISVCTWKNCKQGAVSVSVDDEYTSCMSELETYGYRGTYFLTETKEYSKTKWEKFNEGFKKGHELGTHLQEHWCVEIPDSKYYVNVDNNIKDILMNTDARMEDVISHNHPCGFTTENITRILKSNWNFLSARGYNFNELEEATPLDWFNMKSYNSHGYPGGDLEPPSYFETVDKAEKEGKWLNLVFHNECTDDGVIAYLPSKNVWVDTIGNVVKYINLRDNAKISNLKENEQEITFDVRTDENMRTQLYKQEITLKVETGEGIKGITENNATIAYNLVKEGTKNYAVFNVKFPINSEIKITRI